MFLGNQQGLNTLEYQPAKLAAIEGLYNTARLASLTLFGIPDDDAAVMRHAIETPDVGSFILTHSWNGAVKGLKEWPVEKRPPVGPPFFAFRVMTSDTASARSSGSEGAAGTRVSPEDERRAIRRACRSSAPGVSRMPAYVRTGRYGDLRIVLSNSDDVLDVQIAATPQEASRVVIMMLSSRDVLDHGDNLTVRHADEEWPPLAPSDDPR